jgi:hypothetical protein
MWASGFLQILINMSVAGDVNYKAKYVLQMINSRYMEYN